MKSVTIASVVLAMLSVVQAQDVVADGAFVNKTITAAELSILADQSSPSSAGYEMFKAFVDGSNRAIVAKKDGTCFAAFSSSLPSELSSGFGLLSGQFENECNSDNSKCCDVRSAVNGGYRTSYRSDLSAALEACAATCADPKTCVVLTGHSQGGGGT
jgi:hypothetical protein